MKKNTLFLLFFVASVFGLNAQIFCPDDIVVSCLSDLTPDECGMATVVSGNYHPSMIKYIDQNETNACNEGIVYRKFYLDVDYSNTYSSNEPSCTQTITLLYSSLPINVQFPTDKEYTCLDEVTVESPTWTYNPCDLVGYTYVDEIFEFEQGACLKIVRTYNVINWCTYDETTNAGFYEGIQILKIIDEVAPEIDNCEDRFFDATENCEATVTLTNSASDIGDCPSGTLTWRVSVDLWGDGTEDLFYGPNEPLPYRLNPVENGATVEIDIPEALGVSKHKVLWKVTDGCGNVRSCSSEFFVEDNKPPTPYCINFTSATLDGADGGKLVIPASFFSLDAIDNCSSTENITLSFSENVEDTEREIGCGDSGFQFFRIYYTDEAGNQDFCEVFMIVFDNTSCFMKYAPEGMISKPDGSPIEGATAYLMKDDEVISLKESDESGFFNFGEQDLVETYFASVKSENRGDDLVDIEDFILMRSGLLGLESLDFYQKVAADIDQNKSFDIDDLYAFRDVLLGKSEIENDDLWTFIPQMHNINAQQNNLEVSEIIPYVSYRGGFDFYGIRTGDLTGAKMTGNEGVNEDEVIDLTLEISNNVISIISDQSFDTDAYQFDLLVYGSQVEDRSENEVLKEMNGGQQFLNLNSQESIHRNQVLMSINVEIYNKYDIEEIVKSTKIYQKGSNTPAKVNWTFKDDRNNASKSFLNVEWNVYPIPMIDRLTVEGSGIKSIKMLNVVGAEIAINYALAKDGAKIRVPDSLPNGVYFLKIKSERGERLIKIIK